MKQFFKFYFFSLMLFLSLFQLDAHAALNFKKVVIWGHKLHSHTHSYIHDAFYKAFKSMGYETYWFDNNDDVRGFDFENCLFLTEGQADKKMPIVASSYYLLHNCPMAKYKSLLDAGHAIVFQVYTNRCKGQHDDIQKIDECIYTSKSGKIVYMPWATDLLPYQIDAMEEKVIKNWGKSKDNIVYWIGTLGGGFHGNVEQIEPFKRACQKNGMKFSHLMHISPEENQKLIFNSVLAPTIVGKWQFDEGYIPCRIFKNISYGQFGITNSETVYNLFEQKIVYNPDTKQLFYDGLKKVNELELQELLNLMDFVKNKHTYLNRVEVLLNLLSDIV